MFNVSLHAESEVMHVSYFYNYSYLNYFAVFTVKKKVVAWNTLSLPKLLLCLLSTALLTLQSGFTL